MKQTLRGGVRSGGRGRGGGGGIITGPSSTIRLRPVSANPGQHSSWTSSAMPRQTNPGQHSSWTSSAMPRQTPASTALGHHLPCQGKTRPAQLLDIICHAKLGAGSAREADRQEVPQEDNMGEKLSLNGSVLVGISLNFWELRPRTSPKTLFYNDCSLGSFQTWHTTDGTGLIVQDWWHTTDGDGTGLMVQADGTGLTVQDGW